MKKGFTLIELISVIILLGIIGLIAFPIISNSMKESREELFLAQLNEIELNAEKWAYENTELLPTVEDGTVTITLLELKKSGYISLDVRDPRTNELIPNDMVITITFKNNRYVFEADGNSGTVLANEYNENAPSLILTGSPLEYVEFGSVYEEKGATALNKDNNSIEVSIMYQYNGVEISSITTNQFRTLTAIYSASDSGYTTRIVRTIIIRDTTPPELTIPENIKLTISQLSTFNILDGTNATDNSGEVITIQTSDYEPTIGEKIVKYTACDSRNNCVTKRRIVTITE